MMLHDYSDLLKKIGDLNLEEKMLINAKETNEKNELARLENELVNSGMLKDWAELNQVLKKAKIRGCAYPVTLPGTAEFTDGYNYVYHVNKRSSGYRQDYYGILAKESDIGICYFQHRAGYG